MVAEGGFSFVYRAEQIQWRRRVAVKVFKLERGDEALRQAFIQEGAIQNELSRHTMAIVPSYDVGTWVDVDGQPRVFTVLEWLDGRTLAEVLREERRGGGSAAWSLARVIEVMAPVAEALAVAHAAGIAHRDVKPPNVFLVEERGRRGARLLDFGVAKLAADHGGGFHSTGGRISAFTLAYAAPEQLRRNLGATGPWTDVYALALVCVDLLLGRRRDDADDPVLAAARVSDPAARPTPARLGVSVPAAVEAVFARALAVSPAERFPDAGSFWSALVAGA
jgi:serine/threonine protein kinase